MQFYRNQTGKGYIFSLVLWIILFFLHTPFITADPDINLSIGRDAHTDEGLYSYQVRNFINHGSWTLHSSDCLLKTPLFELLLLPPLGIFGTKRAVARIFVLLLSLCIAAIMMSGKSLRGFAWIAILVSFTQYYVFHYLHYSMSDTISTICIFASVILVCRTGNDKVMMASVLASLAYFIKFQYLYMILLVPICCSLFFVFRITEKRVLMKQLKLSVFILLTMMLIYACTWFIPNYGLFKYVLNEQTSNRFPEYPGLINQLNNNFRFIFLNDKLWILTILFPITFIAGFFIFFKSGSAVFRKLFLGISCWLLLESHKLFMTYLPSRYLVCLIFAAGIMVSLVLWEFNFSGIKYSSFVRITSLILLVIFAISNGLAWYRTLNERTWSMEQTENYLTQFNFNERPIAGAWATAIGWQCKAITFPVWNKYFNYSDVLEKYNPAMVIAESDESDSDGAFRDAGVSLENFSDSVKTAEVQHWNLKLYWMKNNNSSR